MNSVKSEHNSKISAKKPQQKQAKPTKTNGADSVEINLMWITGLLTSVPVSDYFRMYEFKVSKVCMYLYREFKVETRGIEFADVYG